MDIKRRSFLGGAGALIGSAIGGTAFAQGRPPVSREEFDTMVLENMNAERFTCTVSPRSDEGPFYNPSSLQRREITEGHRGEALKLRIQLGGMRGLTECSPLRGAVVDIWQANALGQYSNVGANIQQEATPGETFMRGHQITDENGYVEFDTIVPGWETIASLSPRGFAVRTTHIHVKIYHEWQIFDTQLYFPDELIDTLYADVEPYRSNRVLTVPGSDQQISRIRNYDDSLFNYVQGKGLMDIERVNGKLVANAVIGALGASNRGLPSFFR